MALIDDQIAALEEAIAAGVLKVRTKSGEGEKEVTYPSFTDLLARLNWLKRKKARDEGTEITSTVGVFDRGRRMPSPFGWERE